MCLCINITIFAYLYYEEIKKIKPPWADKGLVHDILEQLISYATILLDYADESKQDFDELLIERRSASPLGSSKNRYGAIWLHFAVRPFSNRRKVAFI